MEKIQCGAIRLISLQEKMIVIESLCRNKSIKNSESIHAFT